MSETETLEERFIRRAVDFLERAAGDGTFLLNDEGCDPIGADDLLFDYVEAAGIDPDESPTGWGAVADTIIARLKGTGR